jgi:hypothetical protein
MKQTFQSSTATAGFNVLPMAAAPTSPASGDIWIIDSSSPTFSYRRSSQSYTLLNISFSQTLTANHRLTSGTGGAITVQPGAAYTSTSDGVLNRTNAPSHGFGASSTPSVIELYDTNGGSGPGSSKLGVMPTHFTSGESGKAVAVSATNLFTAPGSAVQQVWIITGTITPTSTWSCGSGTGTLAMTIAWTDARGANSYSPISVAATSVSNAVASGTSMNGSYTFQTTIIQKSTTPATYAIAVPSGCTTVSFDYFVSAARIG